MANLSSLPQIKQKSQKRRGRGYGSGKGGHTVGRGAKGTKARYPVGLTFEGTKTKKSLIRRLPLKRGKGKFKSLGKAAIAINLNILNLMPKNTEVTVESLIKYGLVDKKQALSGGVKILGGGELKYPLTVAVPLSKGAAEKITKAGGKIIGKEKPSTEKKGQPTNKAKTIKKATVKKTRS